MQSDSRGDTLKRITKAALGGLAGCALVLCGTLAANGESQVTTQSFSGALTDLDTDDTDGYLTTGVFDSATALLKVNQTPTGTAFSLRVKGIDLTAEGSEYGAHLHTGRCVYNAQSLTGPHFRLPPDTLPTAATEVWFDLAPNEEGVAFDQTWTSLVPQDQEYLLGAVTVPVDGIMSIVIHANPNPQNGAAGNKEACLPLSVPDWGPAPTE
jgi:hypothetical protein